MMPMDGLWLSPIMGSWNKIELYHPEKEVLSDDE